MYDRDNLVVLEYDFGNRDFSIRGIDEVKSDGFSVDLEKNEWEFGKWRHKKIGETRSFYDTHAPMILGGILGVYDITDEEHRVELSHTLTEAESKEI